MNTRSSRLLMKMQLLEPALRHEAEQLWAVSDVKTMYRLYLEQMHKIVRSGVGLMEAAVRVATKLGDNSNCKHDLIQYLEKHIEEERGHDQWLLEDYRVCGGNVDSLLASIPSGEVASMVGAQYYWIMHHHPVMVMGHVAALETNHPPAGFAKRLSELTGYPFSAFRAIARHEKLDLVHKQEILELIDRLELNQREETALGVSALHTLRSGVSVLNEIRGIYAQQKTRSQESGSVVHL